MEEKKMIVSGSYVEIAEHKDYLELENLVCYYDYPNANGSQINYGTTDEEKAATLERAKTLCLMPVYAKCAVNRHGDPTFKGHEISFDSKGDAVFGTVPIGVHYSVKIKKHNIVAADGTAHRLPCLFAKQKIWKRNKNAVAATRRLFAEGKLFNSWEMDVKQYTFKEGVKHLEDYSFLGNALLGYEYASPAYGTGGGAQVISVASDETASSMMSEAELMIAEALYMDSLENQVDNIECEVSEMNENEDFEVVVDETLNEEIESAENVEIDNEAQETEEETAETVETEVSESEAVTEIEEPESIENEETQVAESEEVPAEEETEEKEPEAAALTDFDLRRKVEKALYEQTKEYLYCYHIFPEDHFAWVRTNEDMKSGELHMTEVAYAVSNDEVEIMSMTPVVLMASPREMATLVSERDAKIEELENEVSELKEIKKLYDAHVQELAEKKHEEDVSQLREYAEASGYFSSEELESEEMKALIDSLNAAEIKAMIADRAVAGKKELNQNTETSTFAMPRANLVYDDENVKKRRSNQWRAFLGN